MKTEYMKELLALKEYGSYTLAAEKLFITQPALSRHIAAMEKELETLLVIRDTHQITFTPEGEAACKTFQSILTLYEGYRSKLQEARLGIIGSLRIGMLYYTVSQDFGGILPKFQIQHPKVRVKTASFQPHEIYRALLDDRIDLGIMAKAGYDEMDQLHFREIGRSGAVAMLSASHRLAAKKVLSLDSLQQETVILLKEDQCTTRSVLEAFDRCNFSPVRTIETDHTDTVPFSILENGGVYISGSGYSIPGYEKTIRVIPIENRNLFFIKAFVWKKASANPSIRLFLTYLNNDTSRSSM